MLITTRQKKKKRIYFVSMNNLNTDARFKIFIQNTSYEITCEGATVKCIR